MTALGLALTGGSGGGGGGVVDALFVDGNAV